MVGVDQKKRNAIIDMPSQKKELMSSAMKRTSEWISSQEIPSDITVQIGDASFSLHKFPLVSKSGYIRKLVSESNGSDISVLKITNLPGGIETFELVAKFCYGINFEISTENIAMLRCGVEFLEMTEDYVVGNLVERTEAYINEVVLKSLSSCVTVLVASENLLPMAEQVKLVSHCIDAIAYIACKDSSETNRAEGGNSSLVPQQKPVVDWWAEDLTMIRIDMFQRILIAMTARGFQQYALGPILMLYVQKSLRGLEVFGNGRKKIEPKQEHEKRVVLETIVSLLPKEKNVLSVSFLSMLLRSSIYLETTVACRLDLEKRMAIQLSQAVLDDLLIPSYAFTGDTLFDVETVRRVIMNYLEFEVEGNRLALDDHLSAPSNNLEKVGKLMEIYLAEIASDRNVNVAKFVSIAELVPEQSRVTEDGMYRAIDIFLKAHPTLSEVERKKACSLMDCQKLSREACAHAAQNDRLPVQTVVQVLYYEQQRMREAMSNNTGSSPAANSPISSTKSPNVYPKETPSSHERLKLKQENEDLKIELLKLKTKLREVEKPELVDNNNNNNNNNNMKSLISPAGSSASNHQKPPLPRKSLISSVKKLGKLFLVGDVLSSPNSKGRKKAQKVRRHSIA